MIVEIAAPAPHYADPFMLACKRHEELVLARDSADMITSARHFAKAEHYRVQLDVIAAGGSPTR